VRQDVLRRDFTINGLLYDPLDRRVIDYVDGQSDIQAKLVRAIGDPRARFDEDKLRILRAVRFGARLGYEIEPATWEAVRAMAPKIHQVSSERIREELSRILTEGQAARGFRLLDESGLRGEILPELEWTEHVERSLDSVKRGAEVDFAMGVLLHHTPVAGVQNIVNRLKFSRAEMQHIISLVENLPRFSEVRRMSMAKLKRFFRLNRFEDHVELAQIHLTVQSGDLGDVQYVRQKRAEWTEQDILPQPLVTGDDLIAMGFVPGPLFKDILTRVEEEQLDGRLTDRTQALDFVRREYRPPHS
jgi:poly(A) polymerase